MGNIKEDYIKYISNDTNIRKIPTGIQKLDNIYGGGLPNGLTILGAITGLGKTTFALQLADNMASVENTKVLFFSLELSKYELLSKSLSRLSYLDNDLTPHTPNEFMNNKVTDIENYFNKYEPIQDNLFLVDNVRDIKGILNNSLAFIKSHSNDKVVIIIDYLQYISCNSSGNDKQNIDNITRQLKAFSTDYSASIIAISSINRTSYKNNTIGSFKESGSIEYTADYLISLEEKETSNNLAFNTDDNIITLTFLKNRFGTKDSIDLTYYGNYATFIEN